MKNIRILSLVIAAITLLTLCACNPGGTPAQSSADPAETTATPTEQTSASTTQAPETTKNPETTKAPEISTEPEQTYATPATVDGVYQLSTIDDLFWFMEDGPRDGKYALTNDIVFNDVANIAEWSIENPLETPLPPSAAALTATVTQLPVFMYSEQEMSECSAPALMPLLKT